MDGWRRQMVESGHELFSAALQLASETRSAIAEIPDVEVLDTELLGAEASHDLDRLQVLIEVSGTGCSGYQTADWLRENCQIDVGMSDHRRVLATLSFADDTKSTQRLIDALWQWRTAADEFDRPPAIHLPSPDELELQTVMLPRDAFFGATEMVPFDKAAGRIAAEQVTPYPPGIPVIVPGEELTEPVIGYLRSGAEAGMTLPDPVDPTMQTFRVVR